MVAGFSRVIIKMGSSTSSHRPHGRTHAQGYTSGWNALMSAAPASLGVHVVISCFN